VKALLAVALVGVGLAAGAETPVDRFTAAQDAATAAVLREGTVSEEKPGELAAKLDALTREWATSAGSPDRLREAQVHALRELEFGKRAASGAAQVSQVASEAALKLQVVQLQQNQRIIELLEQMAKPRP
jgi:hypothetical protein